jgi:pimeloyl-ACP methyl ester carboxylesterase
MKPSYAISLVVLGALAALVILTMSLRSHLTRPFIFPAPDYRFTPALPGGKIVTARGERIAYGYYARTGKRLVVFFHGNGEVMGSMQDLAAEMLKQGMSVLLAEYPGYGYAAAYTASETNLYTDAQLLIETVQRDGQHKKEDTVLWGFSLGTGVAVEMAARGLGGSLLLMAPFTSMVELAEKHFTPLARLLVVDRFDSASKAPKINLPVLVIHGDRDQVIPVAQARQLAKIFPSARYIEVAGADHNDILQHITQSSWRDAVKFVRGD